MNRITWFPSVPFAAATALLFAGCAAPSLSPTGAPSGPSNAAAAPSGDLYIADYGNGRVAVLRDDRRLREVATITDGIDGPQDVTIDTDGNLYVVNTVGDNIAEYPSGASSPSFVYNAGMVFPVTMAVDRAGHVYEADQGNRSGNGILNEYNQGSNAVQYSCSLTNELEGVALDTKGDVFVSYATASHGGGLAEYKGGLAAGCNAAVLPVHIFAPGSLVLDDHNNIILADQVAERVQLIPPPYAQIRRKIGVRFQDPYHISIDEANKKLFVTDEQKNKLFIVDYPSGKIDRVVRAGPGTFGVIYGAVAKANEVH